MAEDTNPHLRNLVIYEVFPRNHGPTGTFADIEADLRRIRALGVDVLWLMPVQPIGIVNRKGSLGSPYSIRDYRSLNPEFGSERDFVSLLDVAHNLGLKVIIDVVFNHTAFDSDLMAAHGDWYRRGSQGEVLTPHYDWTDVAALKYPSDALSEYLLETLSHWTRLGVDGFRCDCASHVPLDFWLKAREHVAATKSDAIWLGESSDPGTIRARRAAGFAALSDSELYRAFDVLYDYDVWLVWRAAVEGHLPVSRYLELLCWQDGMYPLNHVKLRCVENHDHPRIMQLASSRNKALAWTAFQAFNKGAFLIYGGQESASDSCPSLFDLDKVRWGQYELAPFLTALTGLKKHPAVTGGRFVITAASPSIQAAWQGQGQGLYGVFNVEDEGSRVAVPLPDGTYNEVLGGGQVTVRNGELQLRPSATILSYPGDYPFEPLQSILFGSN